MPLPEVLWLKIWKQVQRAWKLPFPFAIVLVLGGAVGFFLTRWHYQERIIVLESRIAVATVVPTPIPSNNNVPGHVEPAVASAPNGIAIAGGHVDSATVNNLSPPPWRLSDGSFQRLVALFRESPALQVDMSLVTAAFGDPDSGRMAKQFVDAFRAAGWDIPGDDGYNLATWTKEFDGIRVLVHSQTSLPPILQRLADELVTAKVTPKPMNVVVNGDVPEGGFRIEVGHRPR